LTRQPIDVLWIDQKNYHVFQPLLYQVATGLLDPETIAVPLRFCARRWPNVRVVLGEITDIDLARRTVTAGADSFVYDYLLLATGSTTNFFGNSELESHAWDMKGLTMSLRLRAQILESLERAAMEAPPGHIPALEFAVVGGGPTGVELAAALSHLLRCEIPKDYQELDTKRIPISLLQAGDALLPSLPRAIQVYAQTRLEAQGVSIRLGSRVQHFDGRTVTLDNGECLAVPLLIWTAGIHAPPLIAKLPVGHGPGGRIEVNRDLQIPAYPEVYVLGDLTYCKDALWPQNAPFARQSGIFAARAVLHAALGVGSRPRFHYRDIGTMVALGPMNAVVYLPWLGRFGIRGFGGWMIWLFFHIGALVGFRNRFAALLDWGSGLINRRPAAGLIVSYDKRPTSKN
jgi:NADH dehydrogenase